MKPNKRVSVNKDGRAVLAGMEGEHLDYCLCITCPIKFVYDTDSSVSNQCGLNAEMDLFMSRTETKIPVWECKKLGDYMKTPAIGSYCG